MRESGVQYLADLALPCQDGVVPIRVAEEGAVPGTWLCFSPETIAEDIESCVALVREQVAQRGGIQPG